MLLYYSIITDKTVKKNITVYQIELENSPQNPGYFKKNRVDCFFFKKPGFVTTLLRSLISNYNYSHSFFNNFCFFSQVYSAFDGEKTCAIKYVNLEDADAAAIQSYINEITLLKRLQDHGSIIKLYDW